MAITLEKKQFFKKLKKSVLDNHMRNVVPKFQTTGLNDVATIEKSVLCDDCMVC